MSAAVFVGPSAERVLHLGGGRQKILLSGWVHVLHFDTVTREKRAALSSSAAAVERLAREMGAQFFPVGSWEGDAAPAGKTFPAIRPDVWRALTGAGGAL